MGQTAYVVAFADSAPAETIRTMPALDRVRAELVMQTLFTDATLTSIDAEPLLDAIDPGHGDVHVAAFPGLTLVFGFEDVLFAEDGWTPPLPAALVYRLAISAELRWLFAEKWINGERVRLLSVAPDEGVVEEGERLDVEAPFWEGRHPVLVEAGARAFPLPFDPVRLGETFLREWFGLVTGADTDEFAEWLRAVEVPGWEVEVGGDLDDVD